MNSVKNFLSHIGSAASSLFYAVIAALSGCFKRLTAFIRRAIPFLKKRIKSFFRTLFHAIIRGTNIYIKKKVPRSAAQFSFYIVLSLFPMLICVNWFVGLLHLTYDDMNYVLSQFLPTSALSIILDYIEYISANQSNAALYAGLVMMITPSSAALRALQGILNDIHNRGRRGSILSFLLSFLASILFLLAIYICIFLLFSGGWLLNLLVTYLHIDNFILDWNWLRFIVLFLLIWLMLWLLYRFLPFSVKNPKEVFDGYVIPGVFFSSVTLVGVSIVFSYFISLSSRYSLVYGSLTSVIILMLWLYVCSNIIIIGGIVNRLCNERARSRKRIASISQKAVR